MPSQHVEVVTKAEDMWLLRGQHLEDFATQGSVIPMPTFLVEREDIPRSVIAENFSYNSLHHMSFHPFSLRTCMPASLQESSPLTNKQL